MNLSLPLIPFHCVKRSLPITAWLGIMIGGAGCSPVETASEPASKMDDRYPRVEVVGVFEPAGESNVRSSFSLADGAGLIGTEETGDMFKTTDGGNSWRKVWDGGEAWGIQDVRNYLRAQDGYIYITTSEPALVARSMDEGESWDVLARARSSRTVGLVELDSGTMLVGLRRSENDRTSILRSTDAFVTHNWIKVMAEGPRQNVTCFGYWGGEHIWAGIGYEGSGKVFHSADEGKTWRQQADFPEARDLMDFFRHGDDIYVLASGVATLFRSGDNGATWSPAQQFWSKGFLGQCVQINWQGKSFWVMTATDQTEKTYRHVLLIAEDPAGEWSEWIELGRDTSGGASNIAQIADSRLVVGTGNHAAQGRAYTLRISE
ncbi:MAG: exo-alpha-sialidase [Opitutaceae bacterium]|jgi:photosystem II stability/assembly factor-like uncharacterized protein|nr:exo-alpha-sialidase [Opitutaceae bacterium]